MTRDAHLAQDAVQEALLLAHRKRAELPAPEGRPDPMLRWLLGAAWRCAKNLTRREQRRTSCPVDASRDAAPDTETPDITIERDETSRVVRGAVGELSPGDQEIIRLRYFEERDYTDIADQLDITEATARKRVQRAMERLRPAVERTGLGVLMIALICWGSPAHAAQPFVDSPVGGTPDDAPNVAGSTSPTHSGPAAASSTGVTLSYALAATGILATLIVGWLLFDSTDRQPTIRDEPIVVAEDSSDIASAGDSESGLPIELDPAPALIVPVLATDDSPSRQPAAEPSDHGNEEEVLFVMRTEIPQPWPRRITDSSSVQQNVMAHSNDVLMTPTFHTIFPYDEEGIFILPAGNMRIEAEIPSLQSDQHIGLLVWLFDSTGARQQLVLNLGANERDEERGYLMSLGRFSEETANLPWRVCAMCLSVLSPDPDGGRPTVHDADPRTGDRSRADPYLLGSLTISWSALEEETADTSVAENRQVIWDQQPID